MLANPVVKAVPGPVMEAVTEDVTVVRDNTGVCCCYDTHFI